MVTDSSRYEIYQGVRAHGQAPCWSVYDRSLEVTPRRQKVTINFTTREKAVRALSLLIEDDKRRAGECWR